MFSIRQLSEKIADVASKHLDVDGFEEWFVSESWGHYDVRANETSRMIAAVHHVLHSCDSDEIEESKIAEELANAIRPFEYIPASTVSIRWAESGDLADLDHPSAPRNVGSTLLCQRQASYLQPITRKPVTISNVKYDSGLHRWHPEPKLCEA